ncbi:MAG: hypothetical protein ACI4T1_03625 [Christensenellales bacterium]
MKNIDFMKEASNVYSTKQYIVAQSISFFEIENGSYTITLDRFYKRTKERDKDYSNLFMKNKIVSGGRIKCNVTKRVYFN